MAKTVRTEKRQRGVFGWIFLILFWGFNAIMLFSIIAGIAGNTAGMEQLATDAERTGYAAGTAIGVGLMIMLWAAGAIILGLFVFLTGGKKVITETTEA